MPKNRKRKSRAISWTYSLNFDKNTEMTSTSMAFAMYKPKEGKESELLNIVEKHIPTLQQLGLITSRDTYLSKAQDGTIIEVFEWKDDEAKRMAHANEDIRELWTAMEELCTFPAMGELPEAAQGPFPNFSLLK